MAYMSQSASPRSSNAYANKASPRKSNLEEGPIKELVQAIENSRPEQWQKRTSALVELVAQIPTGNEYSRREAWFNSPPTLRHLHQPIGELLKDARSTVVKRTCECLVQLFARCQGDAKYLFKDLMPVVLSVHAQTVQVIRSQVQTMVLEAIPVVPCKMVMPLWLERLKSDKSRTVREACVLYLGSSLSAWTNVDHESGNPYLTPENWTQIGNALIKVLRDPSPTVRAYAKQGIATIRDTQPDLWDDLIRDPNGPASKDAKLQKWLIKVTDEGELIANDGELSVASRFSHRSYASKGPPSTPNRSSVSGFNSQNRPQSRGRASTGGAVPVAISIGGKQDKSQQPPRPRTGGLGPPLRRPFAQAMDPNVSTSPTNNYGQSGFSIPQMGTPPRPPVPPSPHRARPITQRSPSPSPRRPEARHKVPIRSKSVSSANENEVDDRSVGSRGARARPTPEALNGGALPNNLHVEPPRPSQVIDLVDQPSPQHRQPQGELGAYSNVSSAEMLHITTKSIDQTLAQVPPQQQQPISPPAAPEAEPVEEGPFIASMNELKEHASRRRSRRSIHMKERWSRGGSIGSNLGSPVPVATTIPTVPADAVSSLGGGSIYQAEDPSKPMPPTTTLPEHYVIAEQLLKVHKTHVDQIMETLKIEMDTLRDFEQSLEQEKTPSPDQVLDYFESVGLCLDQRTSAGNILQREMDRISKGAFSNNNNANGGR